MPLTLTQLRTILTRDVVFEDLLTTLRSLGFNTTAWQSGSIQRTLLTAVAEGISELTAVGDALSRIAFNETSIGDALTAFSRSHYANTRVVATATIGTAVLTGAAVGPPHVVVAGDLIIATAVGIAFSNTTGGTIPASGTLSLTFQAIVTGIAGNVANNTIVVMQTPFAGVTVNNPDPGSGTWITTVGVDADHAESQPHRRRKSKRRCAAWRLRDRLVVHDDLPHRARTARGHRHGRDPSESGRVRHGEHVHDQGIWVRAFDSDEHPRRGRHRDLERWVCPAEQLRARDAGRGRPLGLSR